MAGVRFTDLQSRPMEFLDFTSLTLNEFRSWSRPSRLRSKSGWRRGAWMGSRGRLAGLPSINLLYL
jgi:hypothetical protein